MRATPPSRRMSAGTRSSAMTAAAPASSAIFACSASTTSMMTPPFSISARPAFTRNVASSRMAYRVRPWPHAGVAIRRVIGLALNGKPAGVAGSGEHQRRGIEGERGVPRAGLHGAAARRASRDSAMRDRHPTTEPAAAGGDDAPTVAMRGDYEREVARTRRRRAPQPGAALLQLERADALVVLRRVARVDAVGQRLEDREQAGVRAHEGRRVRGVVERAVRRASRPRTASRRRSPASAPCGGGRSSSRARRAGAGGRRRGRSRACPRRSGRAGESASCDGDAAISARMSSSISRCRR